MGMLRSIALGVLWLLAAVGIACGLVWGATAAGLIKPLVVISGSMEPGIMIGDLLVDTKAPASSLKVGDVVSLPSELTHNLVSHRIRKIVADGDGGYTITLKGDNNQFEDALDYRVDGSAWMPRMQLPGVGTVIMRITTPAVALPLIAGVVGLIGLVWLVPAPVKSRRRGDDGTTGTAGEDTRIDGAAQRATGTAVGTAPVGALTRREFRAEQGATT